MGRYGTQILVKIFHLRACARAALLTLALLSVLTQPAAAAIRIEISGVDSTLRRNVLALLSLERYKDRDRIEPDAVARLFRRVDDEVRDALKPYGYYQPAVHPTLTPEDNQRNWRVQISIELGEPVLLDNVSVVVHGAGAGDEVFARVAAAPTLAKGERLEHAAYEKIKTDLQSAAATFGYLDARLLRNELRVDPQAHRANVFIELETGERYYFGATAIDQSVIREGQLRRYLRYHEGQPYDAGKLLRSQFALDDSQFFSSVDVVPGDRDPLTHIVPISIGAKAARNVYSFGAGYGTDTGARGTISWLNPRVNDRGHRLRIQLQPSQRTQSLKARYDIPFGDPVLEKLSMQLLNESQQNTGGLDTSEVSFRPSITQSLGRWQRVLGVNLTHTVTNNLVDNPDGTPRTSREVANLIVPGVTYASVPEGYLGEDLFSRTLYAELIGSHSVLGSKANFLRLDLRAERVLDLTPRWHVLLRGELGASVVGNFSELPGIYRFYAGGDRSVRGFGFDELSPIGTKQVFNNNTKVFDTVSVKVGSRHLLTGTVELERDLPRNFGVAVFTDFGNAVDHLDAALALSVGIGFRWRLPVLTVGIDVAKAVAAPGFSSLPGPHIHLNISPKL